MKEQLLKLYEERQPDFKAVRDQFAEEDMAGPLLISPSKNYPEQKVQLLIIGQETNGWHYYVDDLKKQMEVYEEFNVGENYYPTPFWNVTRKIEKAFGNDPFSCSWTNISKYDLNAKRSYGVYEKAISTLDNVLIDEIKILDPKVCMFFTGPHFDYRIKGIYSEIEFLEIPDWTLREFCQLKHPNLPELTFRSHHPKYLRISGLEEEFMKFISELIKKII